MLASSDLGAINQLEHRWLAHELAGRASEVLELCSPDTVWLPPGQPPLRGRAAVREWLATSGGRIQDIQLTRVAIDGHSSGAYKLATFHTRYVPDGSTEALTVTGWHLWVLHRDAESRWRVGLVVWNITEA